MGKATVIIPTMRRPECLKAAVQSLFCGSNPEHVEQLIIVDNDPAATATETANYLSQYAPFPVAYYHEATPGIATARNTGVKAAGTCDYIAFLDDDETASTNWLANLLAVQSQFNADVVFGPISGKAPLANDKIRPAVEIFFSRHGPHIDTMTNKTYGCGNSLMKRSTAFNGSNPFAVSSDQTGGEDDTLFAQLKRQNAVFAWAANAVVEEHAPAHRSTIKYLLQRAFARGQGPSQTAASQRNIGLVIYWMSVGTAQFALYSAASILFFGTLSSRGSSMMIKAAEGFGKILWFSSLEPKFYGQAELDRH